MNESEAERHNNLKSE